MLVEVKYISLPKQLFKIKERTLPAERKTCKEPL
jgi:hypothetical protein